MSPAPRTDDGAVLPHHETDTGGSGRTALNATAARTGSDGPAGRWDRWPARPLLAACAAVLLLPPLLATSLSLALSPVYAVEVEILYRGPGTTSDQGFERELATQELVLRGRTLIDEAAEEAGLDGEDLAKAVHVETVDTSNVILLRVEDEDPRRADAVAGSLVRQYLEVLDEQVEVSSSEALGRELLEERTRLVSERLAEVERQLVDREVAVRTGTAEALVLSEEAVALRQQVNILQSQLVELELRALQRNTEWARVLTPPRVLDEPVSPQPLRAFAAGLLVGLVLSGGLALVLLSRARSQVPAAA